MKVPKLIKDKLLNKIIRNSGIILFGNSTASVINFISFAIVAKQLGPDVFAILVLAQTYSLIINDIFNVQTWESMIKFGARKTVSKIKQDPVVNVIKSNLFIDIFSAILACFFAILLLKPISNFLNWDELYLDTILFYCISIVFNITTLTIGVPRFFNKFLEVAKCQIFSSIVKIALVLTIYFFEFDVILYIYAYMVSDILTNIILIIFSLNILKNKFGVAWWKSKVQLDMNQIKFIWWTNLRTVIRIPVRHLDMIIISSIMSFSAVGTYKVYKEIAGLINRIGEPINQSVYPEFAKLIGVGKQEKALFIVTKSILLLIGLGLIITVFMLFISKTLIYSFFGDQYLSEPTALYIMIILYGISFITVPINSLFIAAGFARYSFLLVLLSNSVYLIVALTFGWLYGIYGIIAAYAVQLLINKGFKIYFLNKHYDEWGLVVR